MSLLQYPHYSTVLFLYAPWAGPWYGLQGIISMSVLQPPGQKTGFMVFSTWWQNRHAYAYNPHGNPQQPME